MPYVEVEGQKWFYTHHRGRKDAGPPLVLIHGAGGNHLIWPAEIRRLPGYSVYALDLPGHGKSEGPAHTRIEAYAEGVRAWADAVGVDRFIPVGHSMGGAIAQELALTHPERVAALVLMATGARLRVHPSILRGLRENPEGTVRFLADWAYGPEPDPNLVKRFIRQTLELPPEVAYGDFLACDVWDRMADVHRIQAPTLLIAGEADRLTPPKYLRYLEEQIPNARLVLIPEAGHMVMLEAPEAVAHALQEWLSR
ncbi:MAG: alpha/beta hydrolase [Chloroflexi bacterium]|nr:alpha/beta hydrolase [Chloroflexota bacterium]